MAELILAAGLDAYMGEPYLKQAGIGGGKAFFCTHIPVHQTTHCNGSTGGGETFPPQGCFGYALVGLLGIFVRVSEDSWMSFSNLFWRISRAFWEVKYIRTYSRTTV